MGTPKINPIGVPSSLTPLGFSPSSPAEQIFPLFGPWSAPVRHSGTIAATTGTRTKTATSQNDCSCKGHPLSDSYQNWPEPQGPDEAMVGGLANLSGRGRKSLARLGVQSFDPWRLDALIVTFECRTCAYTIIITSTHSHTFICTYVDNFMSAYDNMRDQYIQLYRYNVCVYIYICLIINSLLFLLLKII